MFIAGMDKTGERRDSGLLVPSQERAEYLHAQHLSVGDILIWDNICAIHNAIGDYTAD